MNGVKLKKPYHTINPKVHTDCLVGGSLGGRFTDFKIRAQNYMDAILPTVVVSYPGLSLARLSSYKAPGGDFKGKTVQEVLQYFRHSKISASILGCNDEDLFKQSPAVAFRIYLDYIEKQYQGTDFKVIFLTTVFTRRAELSGSKRCVFEGREAFNKFMIDHVGHPKFAMRIKSVGGEVHDLDWRVVDMTKIIPPSDLHSDRYFCTNNPDGIHFNAIIWNNIYDCWLQE